MVVSCRRKRQHRRQNQSTNNICSCRWIYCLSISCMLQHREWWKQPALGITDKPLLLQCWSALPHSKNRRGCLKARALLLLLGLHDEQATWLSHDEQHGNRSRPKSIGTTNQRKQKRPRTNWRRACPHRWPAVPSPVRSTRAQKAPRTGSWTQRTEKADRVNKTKSRWFATKLCTGNLHETNEHTLWDHRSESTQNLRKSDHVQELQKNPQKWNLLGSWCMNEISPNHLVILFITW